MEHKTEEERVGDRDASFAVCVRTEAMFLLSGLWRTAGFYEPDPVWAISCFSDSQEGKGSLSGRHGNVDREK